MVNGEWQKEERGCEWTCRKVLLVWCSIAFVDPCQATQQVMWSPQETLEGGSVGTGACRHGGGDVLII